LDRSDTSTTAMQFLGAEREPPTKSEYVAFLRPAIPS
jgi:hypothetical protein